jgi:hypothetical protein
MKKSWNVFGKGRGFDTGDAFILQRMLVLGAISKYLRRDRSVVLYQKTFLDRFDLQRKNPAIIS